MVREYMNMLDVAAMLPNPVSPQAIDSTGSLHQAECYCARGCYLADYYKRRNGCEERPAKAGFYKITI